MSDKLKLYKLNYSGAEINERLEKVDANFEKIAENLAAINENTAADAQFKTEVANTYAKKSDMPNMELYALKSELPVMPDLTNYALKSELPNMANYALKSDIPEGQDLSVYATKAEIEAAGYLTTHQDLSNYALKSELPVVPELPDFEKFALKSEMPSVEGLATSEAVEAVNTKIDTVLANAPAELDTLKEIADLLETKQDAKDVVDALATKANSADVYTKTEIDSKGFITELPTIPTVPTNVSAFENDANYLTEQSLNTYATKQYVDDAVAEVAGGGEINIDAYVTKDYVDNNFQQKGNYLTEHQDLSSYVTTEALGQAGYITSNDVPTKVSEFENDAQYLTLETLPEYPSTNGLATETYVSEKIAEVVGGAPETLDTLKEIATALDDKATMTMVTTAIETKANKSEVEESFNTVDAALNNKVDSATLDNYATKTYVSEQGFLTENDLSDYVTNEDLNTAAYLTSSVAANTYQVKGNYLTLETLPEYPSTNGLATEDYVREKIADVVGGAPETLDTLNEIATVLNDKATVTMVSDAISTKANSADVYTKTEIDNAGYLTKTNTDALYQPKGEYLTEQSLTDYVTTDALSNASYLTQTDTDALYQPKGNYLTEHQSLANYATLEYVNEKIAKLQGLIEQLQALHNTNEPEPEPEPTEPEKSVAPTLTYDDTNFTVTATGEGTVIMYVDNVETNNPHTFGQGENEVTYTVTATAQQEGKEVSDTVTLECVVPAETPAVNPEDPEQPNPENQSVND